MSKEKVVDNNGKGNCMYYAYGISLMYFLLKKKDLNYAEQIFTRLELSQEQKQELYQLLNNPTLTEFSYNQITNVIEPILGSATRRIAALQTKQELLEKPNRSSLLTSINYGIVEAFRSELEKNIDLALKQTDEKTAETLLFLAEALNEEDNASDGLSGAEVYRVFKATHFSQHARAHYETILKEYELKWPNKLKEIYNTKLAQLKTTLDKESLEKQIKYLKLHKLNCIELIEDFPQEWNNFIEHDYKAKAQAIPADQLALDPSVQHQFLNTLLAQNSAAWNNWYKKRLNNDPYYHNQFLSTLIYQTALDFFTANNNENIDKYVAHLSKEYVWGSDETLVLLHDYIQGPEEHLTDYNRIEIRYNNEISLAIYSNGILKSGLPNHSSDIELNNIRNAHWLSFVQLPESEPKKQTTYESEDLFFEQIFDATQEEPFDDVLMIADRENDLVQTNTDETEVDLFEIKMDYLESSKFNTYLNLFKEKIATLETTSPQSPAHEEAQTIYDELVILKTNFLNGKNIVHEQFCAQGLNILTNAPQTELQKHRGIQFIFNELSNSLFFIESIFTYHSTEYVDTDFLRPDEDPKPIVESKKSSLLANDHQEKIDYLESSQFNSSLKLFNQKKAILKDKSPEAHKEAKAIYKKLNTLKIDFLDPQKNMTAESFCKQGHEIICNAPKTHLQTHRGFKKVLNALLNALIFIANLFTKTDYDRIQTDSSNRLSAIDKSLSTSLEAYKAIRAREEKKAQQKTSEMVNDEYVPKLT